MAKDCSLIVFITEIKLIKVAFQMKDMRNELTILTTTTNYTRRNQYTKWNWPEKCILENKKG